MRIERVPVSVVATRREIALDVVYLGLGPKGDGWQFAAVDDKGYEGGDPLGHGATPDAAIADLLEILESA